MNKLPRSRKIGVVLVLISIVGLIVAGWAYVSGAKDAPHVTASGPRIAIYTDTAKHFAFTYPGEWTMKYSQDGKEFVQGANPDWSVVSRPLYLQPSSGRANNPVWVQPGCEMVVADGQKISVLQDLKNRKDKFHTQQSIQIHGYDGYYDRVDFVGDAESYTDHVYYVTNGTYCVTFRYREKQNHPMSDTIFDDGGNITAYKNLVNSIAFQ